MSDTNITTPESSKKPDDGFGTLFGIGILVIGGIIAYKYLTSKSEPKTLSSIREDDLLRDLYGEDFLK